MAESGAWTELQGGSVGAASAVECGVAVLLCCFVGVGEPGQSPKRMLCANRGAWAKTLQPARRPIATHVTRVSQSKMHLAVHPHL